MLIRLIPLLLLVIAFFLWRRYIKKLADAEDRLHLPWYKKSWIWLVIAAVVMSVVMALFSVTMDMRLNTRGNYIPSQYKEGKFVPGRYE